MKSGISDIDWSKCIRSYRQMDKRRGEVFNQSNDNNAAFFDDSLPISIVAVSKTVANEWKAWIWRGAGSVAPENRLLQLTPYPL